MRRVGARCAGSLNHSLSLSTSLFIMKPDFFPEIPDLSQNNMKENLVLFPSGNFAGRNGPHWKLRRGAPGRTGIFHVPLLHTWLEGHGSFKTNVLTPSTAMPRRIAQLFVQIQVGSDYLKMICVSQIFFVCFVDLRIVLFFSPARPQMSTGSGRNPLGRLWH